jgi:hypothetical protein
MLSLGRPVSPPSDLEYLPVAWKRHPIRPEPETGPKRHAILQQPPASSWLSSLPSSPLWLAATTAAFTISAARHATTAWRSSTPRVAATTGTSASPSSPSRSCTGHLPAILPAILADSVTRSVDQAVDDPPRMLEITERPQHLARGPCRLISREVRPGRRDQRTGAVRQHQDQVQAALPAHPAEHPQRSTTEWVTLSDDRHLRREVLQVGSVSPTRSRRSRTTG